MIGSSTKTQSRVLLRRLVEDFPQHSSEHRLSGSIGPYLADCLSGNSEALHILLAIRQSKDLLEDVYTSGPVFATGTRPLTTFLSKTMDATGSKSVKILEIGAGTGSTTTAILEQLKIQELLLLAHSQTFRKL